MEIGAKIFDLETLLENFHTIENPLVFVEIISRTSDVYAFLSEPPSTARLFTALILIRSPPDMTLEVENNENIVLEGGTCSRSM